jgi:hypothetical protein
MNEIIKKFIEDNPDLIPYKKSGRPLGRKNAPRVLEVMPEDLKHIELTEKQIKLLDKSKKPRKPRAPQTDEQRAAMLENLSKGRALAAKGRAERKLVPKAPSPEPKPVPVPVVKEGAKYYPVPPRKKERRKKVVVTETDDTEADTEPTTTDIDVKQVRKRIDRKTKLLESLEKTLEVKPTVANTMSPFERLLMSRM